MPHPLIIQYLETICNPWDMFKTLSQPRYIKDIYGKPYMSVGGNSVTFKVDIDGKIKALKCYTKPKKNTRIINAHLAEHPDPLIYPAQLLEEEMYVFFDMAGRYYDVLLSDWCDCRLLDFEIKRCVCNGHTDLLARYTETFCRFAYEILSRPWAHGDIKPENIFVMEDGSFKLFDTDAMYLPCLDGSDECGTENYRHPLRTAEDFGPHIDDYPLALMAVTMRALVLDMSLLDRYCTNDNLLLVPQQEMEGRSECFNEMELLFARNGEWRYVEMLHCLKSPTAAIAGIKEMFGGLLGHKCEPALPLESFCGNGKWGYKDANNNVVIPAVFDMAAEFTEGIACVNLCGHHHYINPCGEVVINGSAFDAIKPFRNNRAMVTENGFSYYIDKDGNRI